MVELAGLAGAGKSSIARALVALDPGIRARPRISLWRHIASVPPLVPSFVNLHWPFRGVLVKEMKRILRLSALHRLADETKDCRMLVFDEGPVYFLARTLVFGGENIKSRAFEKFWRHAIEGWAQTLSAIVWLEAPEPLLVARLQERPEHPFGKISDQAVSAFFRKYREAYTRVIAELIAAGGPAPWTIQTQHGTAAAAAPEILVGLRASRGPA